MFIQDFKRLSKPIHTTVHWPKERRSHSSVVISSVSSDGVKSLHLIVMGGLDSDNNVIPDCWIMNIEKRCWIEVRLLFT